MTIEENQANISSRLQTVKILTQHFGFRHQTAEEAASVMSIQDNTVLVTKGDLNDEIALVRADIKHLEEKIDLKFDSVDKRFDSILDKLTIRMFMMGATFLTLVKGLQALGWW